MKKIMQRISMILFLFLTLALPASAEKLLIPGGQVIGMQLQDGTLTVASFDETLGDAARSAGMQVGDRLVQINENPITDISDIREALTASKGAVKVKVQRNGKTKQLTVSPAATEEGPRLGVYLRQGTSGLGTVTYYDPDTTKFGALGHGVNTPSGELLKLRDGSVYAARIFSVKKGKVGAPGQLMGRVTGETTLGAIEKNTEKGVFGTTAAKSQTEALPVASPSEARTGSATIRSTVDGETLREYSVEILKIYPNSGARSRNLLLKVTDPALLETTGGIVQGMSGSPIIQDGKLVGAVTHVLVNDPTTGYGIFIENMLDAAA